jgi:hypothetical protein
MNGLIRHTKMAARETLFVVSLGHLCQGRGDGSHASVKEGNEHDADTVSISEGSRVVVDRGDQNSADHQKPVGKRDVQLTVEDFRRMPDGQLGEVRQFHDLV